MIECQFTFEQLQRIYSALNMALDICEAHIETVGEGKIFRLSDKYIKNTSAWEHRVAFKDVQENLKTQYEIHKELCND